MLSRLLAPIAVVFLLGLAAVPAEAACDPPRHPPAPNLEECQGNYRPVDAFVPACRGALQDFAAWLVFVSHRQAEHQIDSVKNDVFGTPCP